MPLRIGHSTNRILWAPLKVDMMTVRSKHLYRAYRAIAASPILKSRRLYSSTTPRKSESGVADGTISRTARDIGAKLTEGIDPLPTKILQDQRNLAHTLENLGHKQLHPTLAPGYVNGGHLKRTHGPRDLSDKDGLPTYGANSIPIEFASSSVNKHGNGLSELYVFQSKRLRFGS